MKVTYVQSYPIYHDNLSDDAWLALENRDKWMPALTTEGGVAVELWAVGATRQDVTYTMDGATITIRLFKSSARGKQTKFHYSDELIEFATQHNADHYVIKGVDGGVGVRLITNFLKPRKIPFSFIVGGKCQSVYNKDATLIFYESDRQLDYMTSKRWGFLPGISSEKLYKLPKSVDVQLFNVPDPMDKKYDLITIGRLIPYYKNYSSLISLASEYRIAVIGGGPLLDEFRVKYPNIDWLGHIPYDEVPGYLRRAKVLFYPSVKDFFPRAISEAVSCGLPVAAFDTSISADVVRPEFGILMNQRTYRDQLRTMLDRAEDLDQMGLAAKKYAAMHWHKYSTAPAIKVLMSTIGKHT
jgi:glycosyltransferase involved in cell wall biosynthesis